jgi:hypothetical protein
MPEILSLLRETFQAQPDSPNLDPGLLRWKYFDSGPDSGNSRSYVIRKGQAIAAHACAWPIRLATPGGLVNAIQMLDWASSKKAPGFGVILARKLEEMAPVLITVGGSEATHEVLPKIGFARYASFGYYARVLRPWRQFLTRPSEGPKALPRLIRNMLWSRSPIPSTRDWSSQAARPDPDLLARLDAQAAAYPRSIYSVAFLGFMLRCPGTPIRYFSLIKDGSVQGYFLLTRVGGQTRLADLRILSTQLDDWISACAAMVHAACQDPDACELVATAPLPLVAMALEKTGFRSRGSLPVFVRDPRQLLSAAGQIQLSMLDDDSAYLNYPEPYAT